MRAGGHPCDHSEPSCSPPRARQAATRTPPRAAGARNFFGRLLGTTASPPPPPPSPPSPRASWRSTCGKERQQHGRQSARGVAGRGHAANGMRLLLHVHRGFDTLDGGRAYLRPVGRREPPWSKVHRLGRWTRVGGRGGHVGGLPMHQRARDRAVSKVNGSYRWMGTVWAQTIRPILQEKSARFECRERSARTVSSKPASRTANLLQTLAAGGPSRWVGPRPGRSRRHQRALKLGARLVESAPSNLRLHAHRSNGELLPVTSQCVRARKGGAREIERTTSPCRWHSCR